MILTLVTFYGQLLNETNCRYEKHFVGKEAICPHCDKKVKNRWNGLKHHIDGMHPDCGLEKKFPCDECKKTYIFECSLKSHKMKQHR